MANMVAIYCDRDWWINNTLHGGFALYTLILQMQVNAKFCGKTALHCAAAAGKVSVMKMLFEFQADVEIEVKAVCNTLHKSL